MQQANKSYYQLKAEEVLLYVNNHLSEDLNVKVLSEKFGISFFYFHRILKAFLNEPLGSYINRIRLDTAVKLIRYSDKQISDVALTIGYNDISSFSKAFSKEFGISPQEFKTNKEIVLNTHIDYKISDSGKIVSDLKPKIITLTDKKVVSIRIVGEYGGEKVYTAWNDLLEFSMQNNLFGWKPDIFSVYYDEPEEAGINNCRSDICVATSRNITTSGQISTKTISGGKFAAFRYKGPYERLWELYETIYYQWIYTSNLKFREIPWIEKYLNYSPKTKPEDLLTEIYIPIE